MKIESKLTMKGRAAQLLIQYLTDIIKIVKLSQKTFSIDFAEQNKKKNKR